MKKAIGGFRYDTDTAIQICKIFTGTGHSDFSCIDAWLYKTKRSGSFFLAGWGGPMTKFGRRCSDGTLTDQETIVPIDEETARSYAEKFAKPEDIEKFFKEVDA